jgi:glycosyltransferase involved in cell wall biosynthesis
MKKKALMTASVASMIDLFNMDNIRILQQLGYEVHVASNFKFGSITSQERVDAFRKELKEAGIRVCHIPIPRSIGDIKNIVCSYRQMKRLLEKERYAIVHTQSPIGGVVTRLAAGRIRKHGGKVIYTAHGFHFFKGALKKNWMLFYPIEKFLSRYTDVLITINQEDYQRAQKFHAKRVCHVSGIGVDIQKFSEENSDREKVRESFGVSEQDFLLLSVGQLSKRKNQSAVIRALSKIPDSSVKYMAVGLGECEQFDRGLAKELHVEDRVIFAGYHEDVSAFLHAADCFIFPSLQEGLPVSLMEAMAAKVPVICSRIRGNVDLVTDGREGILVEPMDVEGDAEAVLWLKFHPEAATEYRKNAFNKIKENSIHSVHRQMEKIYKTI